MLLQAEKPVAVPAAKPAAGKPAADDAPAKPAADDAAEKPAADDTADKPAADDTTDKPEGATSADEPAAVVVTDEEKPSNATKSDDQPASLDAAATVEELPGGPKAMIEVVTSIQPLTRDESDSVLGTTESQYFKQTFRKTLAATNLTMTDEMVVKVAEPAKEFTWPKAPPAPKKKKENKSECPQVLSLGALLVAASNNSF